MINSNVVTMRINKPTQIDNRSSSKTFIDQIIKINANDKIVPLRFLIPH